MAQVEIFTTGGVISGSTPRLPLVADGPDLQSPLPLTDARWYPNDGSPPSQVDSVHVPPDDILVVVTPEPDVRVHATWYPITLELGPYRVTGQISTPPGFDPARALTRPGGAFVPVWDAVVELRDRVDSSAAERAHVEVNRYAVERVVSPLTLAFHFPGATLVTAEGAPVA